MRRFQHNPLQLLSAAAVYLLLLAGLLWAAGLMDWTAGMPAACSGPANQCPFVSAAADVD